MTFHTIGIFTLFFGTKMAFETKNNLIMVFNIVLGSMIGQLVNLDERMENLSNWLKKRSGLKEKRITERFVTATLIYCVGLMVIVGAVEEELGG